MLIDFGRQAEVPERDLILEYLGLVDDVLDDLDSRDEVAHVRDILERGTGADRQLRVYEESGHDLRQVVAYMAEETRAGV
jgi:carboxylate-amine ligase